MLVCWFVCKFLNNWKSYGRILMNFSGKLLQWHKGQNITFLWSSAEFTKGISLDLNCNNTFVLTSRLSMVLDLGSFRKLPSLDYSYVYLAVGLTFENKDLNMAGLAAIYFSHFRI